MKFLIFTAKLKPRKLERTTTEYLASLSISPKEPNQTVTESTTSVIAAIDIDVYTIFDENYQQTVKELSALIKDKLKLINIK